MRVLKHHLGMFEGYSFAVMFQIWVLSLNSVYDRTTK
jgi:hypothetical protein